nr:FHA domain-containing protein [Bifidobacterium leontopitheci]
MTELTFAILKYGFLILLWVFVWLAVRSLRKDIETFSPQPSRARRRRDKRAMKNADTGQQPAAARRSGTPAQAPRTSRPQQSARPGAPTLLVLIDGPKAGASVPLNGESITVGRAASNTVVLDDEFVSSHHARVYQDPASGQWAIEDLGSTNGTIVNQQRLKMPMILPPRVPVRIGATTFELR